MREDVADCLSKLRERLGLPLDTTPESVLEAALEATAPRFKHKAERNVAIVRAWKRGDSTADISRWSGLSRRQVSRIGRAGIAQWGDMAMTVAAVELAEKRGITVMAAARLIAGMPRP